MAFSGFPAAGLQFLADLSENNDKEWFTPRKEQYVSQLQEPAIAFIHDLGERLRPVFPRLQADLRANGSGSLMRIYRDVRFSQDKTPYNTHVTALLWEGPGKKNMNPAMGFRLTSDNMMLMLGMYGFPKDKLARFREAVVDAALGAELDDIVGQIRALPGYQLGGEHYKSVPRGFDGDHPRADLLRYNGLHAFPPPISASEVQSPALVDICATHFERLAPLHHWLVKIFA